MFSRYLRLRAIVGELQAFAQELLVLEKEQAVLWIKAQIKEFDILHQELFSLEKIISKKPDANNGVSVTPPWNFEDSETNEFLIARHEISNPIPLPSVQTKSHLYCEDAKQQVSINGFLHINSRQACVELELYQNTVTKRCRSTNEKFKDWFFVCKDTGQPILKIPKITVSTKGRQKTEEEKKKISESLIKFYADSSKPDHRSFMSHSIETNKKVSSKIKGRKLSDDTKERMKLEIATRPFPRRSGQPVRINGTNYSTIIAASKTLQISSATIICRCKNKREEFKEWMYLPFNTQMLKQA